MRVRTFQASCAAIVTPLVALGLTQCSLGSLSYLGPGTDAGAEAASENPPGGDAGADTSPASPVDAGGESSAPDGSSPSKTMDADVESGADAGAADAADAADSAGPPPAAPPIWLDGGTESWCELHTGHLFCADFDEKPLPAGFSASDGAFLAQTSSLASSAPNDLLLYVPPQPGSGTWGSKLSRSFPVAASSIVLAFDFRPDSVNATSAGLLFVGLDFLGSPTAKYSIRLAFNDGAPRVEESYLGSPSDVYHSNFALTPQVWSRIELDLTFPAAGDGGGADAGTATESVYIDGVLQGTTETLTPPAGFDQRPNLLLGAVFGTSPTNGWVLRYDNVTFDAQ